MSTSLLTLERNIGKDGYGYVSGIPTTGGASKTVLVDTSADSPLDTGDSDTLFKHAWLKIEADSAGTPLNVGEVNRITSYAASTGTLTVGRAFTNNFTTTQTYAVYLGVPPTTQGLNKGIAQYINDVLRRLYYRRMFLLTLVTDGDMETSGVTNWTASNTTLTKSTTTGITLGKQSLRVLNTSASGYAQSGTINVEPTQSFHLAADLTVAVGTGTLELYDVTNSASIETVDCSEKETRRIWLTTSLPTSCRQVAVRLSGTGASDDCYWDNVMLINQAATEMPLPSWFKNRKWMERLGMWYPGPTSSEGSHSAVDALDRYPAHFWVIEDRAGYTPFKLQFSPHAMNGTLLVGESLCPYDELSSDSDTTEADADWVKAHVLTLIGMDPERQNDAMVKRWLPEAQLLDRQHQAVWSGQRFKFRTPY